jgi:hypothetical protein
MMVINFNDFLEKTSFSATDKFVGFDNTSPGGEKILVYPKQNNRENVVIKATWLCSAIKNGVQMAETGTVELPAPSENFKEFSELTEEDILNWCYENGVNKNEIESSLISAIDQEEELTPIAVKLPWENSKCQLKDQYLMDLQVS